MLSASLNKTFPSFKMFQLFVLINTKCIGSRIPNGYFYSNNYVFWSDCNFLVRLQILTYNSSVSSIFLAEQETGDKFVTHTVIFERCGI